MSWILAFLFAIPGFAGICLSMLKHQRKVFGRVLPEKQSRLYLRLGFGLVSASILWTMIAYGWSRGLVVSCGVATLASVFVILLLTLCPTMTRFLIFLPRHKAE